MHLQSRHYPCEHCPVWPLWSAKSLLAWEMIWFAFGKGKLSFCRDLASQKLVLERSQFTLNGSIQYIYSLSRNMLCLCTLSSFGKSLVRILLCLLCFCLVACCRVLLSLVPKCDTLSRHCDHSIWMSVVVQFATKNRPRGLLSQNLGSCSKTWNDLIHRGN